MVMVNAKQFSHGQKTDLNVNLYLKTLEAPYCFCLNNVLECIHSWDTNHWQPNVHALRDRRPFYPFVQHAASSVGQIHAPLRA
jgi:hypothetical protein